MNVNEIAGTLNAEGMRFALVISRFNSLFTAQLRSGALDCLLRHGAIETNLTVVWVPGANEIPQVVDRLAASGNFEAVIALGAVIQGATTHADLINNQVARSLAQSALMHKVPVINGVVAANTLEQAIERSGSKAGNKGWDAAQAAIEMASVYARLPS